MKRVTKSRNRKIRCGWAKGELYEAYHDEEWGREVRDDKRFFEFLILEGAQAGLSWITILQKRPTYRREFAQFDPKKVAKFDRRKINELLQNEGLIRHRGKLESVVSNAHAFIAIQQEFGSFSNYVWPFVGGKPIVNRWRHLRDIPTSTSQSRALSKDLKRRGFKFVGPTICYAFMQACGLVDDHMKGCHVGERSSKHR